MLKQLAKTLVFLNPSLRRRCLALIQLAVIAACLEAVATVAIFALIQMVADAGSMADSRMLMFMRQALGNLDDASFIAVFGLLVGGFYCIDPLPIFVPVRVRE